MTYVKEVPLSTPLGHYHVAYIGLYMRVVLTVFERGVL